MHLSEGVGRQIAFEDVVRANDRGVCQNSVSSTAVLEESENDSLMILRLDWEDERN